MLSKNPISRTPNETVRATFPIAQDPAYVGKLLRRTQVTEVVDALSVLSSDFFGSTGSGLGCRLSELQSVSFLTIVTA